VKNVGFTINLGKCEFGKTSVKYLGFIISPEGVKVDPEKTSAVADWPIQNAPKRVKRFLGLCR